MEMCSKSSNSSRLRIDTGYLIVAGFIAGVLVGLAVLAAGLVVVKVTSMRQIRLLVLPAPDPGLELGTLPVNQVGPNPRG
ncbi:MAG TPA: hypothetical protein VKD90_22820 [Gemmataceae bacterium]|nr:hypothetical protein [Gemmataceae bacterium]